MLYGTNAERVGAMTKAVREKLRAEMEVAVARTDRIEWFDWFVSPAAMLAGPCLIGLPTFVRVTPLAILLVWFGIRIWVRRAEHAATSAWWDEILDTAGVKP